jgi:ATP-dependent Clp protease ATP-binding subunit ClpB
VKIQIEHLSTRLAQRNIDLVLADGALPLIVENGYDPIYGARPLKQIIQKYIENPLSMEILKGNIMDGDRISAEVEGDHIIFKTL